MPTHSIEPILDVIQSLLGPQGCPWDKKQTPSTLCDYVLEEAYELVDAIRKDSAHEIPEEIGDVLFLLLFIVTLYEKQGYFSLQQAINANAAKMIRRHPHVFGESSINSQEELLANWEKIKKQEKADATGINHTFSSLPAALPPLLKAYRINSKAARVGFTWENTGQVEEQLDLEWKELQAALTTKDKASWEEEFGDFLFTFAEYARRHGVKPNTALDKANGKFLRRFRAMEELASARGLSLEDMDMREKNRLWNEVKTAEKDSDRTP